MNLSKTTPTRPHTLSRTLLATAVAATMFSAGSVHAQEEEKKRGGYTLVLEEVVVTAQKREENFMSVPIAVDAFTAQDMVNTGAANIQDISDFMPGVEISTGQSTQVGIRVRGVESPNISTGGDPSTATFYDGSYMPRAVTSLPFTDIARTEVLKGPQGTLFGRNATAGVVNIVPNKPHQDFEGNVRARVGNYGLLRLEGMVNTPITDDIALRANVFTHERDGITDNKGIGGDLQDQEWWAARVATMFTLSPSTDIQLAIDYEDRDEMAPAHIGVSKYSYGDWQDPFSGSAANDVVGREETREMYGVSLQMNHDINDDWSMFGIVSYRDWETTNLQDEDGTADPRRYFDSNNIEDSDIFYSELRFHYSGNDFNIVTGANYSQEDVYQRTDIHLLADSYMQFATVQYGGTPDDHAWDPVWLGNILGKPPEEVNDSDYVFLSQATGQAVVPPSFAGTLITETMDNTGDFVNWGIFGDVTYQWTDRVRVAAGLRYSYDDKEYSWQTFPTDLMWPWAPPTFAYHPEDSGADPENYYDKFTDDESWDKFTGRFVVDWEFSDTAMAYFSAATGYKSGGFDGQVFSAVVAGPFDPEEMTSFEVGVKGDFFDNRFRVETAVFYQELDGRQNSVSAKESPDDPTAQPVVISSDDEISGIEIILTWTPIDSLRLSGLTTYRENESTSESYFNSAGEPAGGEPNTSRTNNSYTLRADWTPEIPWGFLLLHMDYVFNEDTDKYDPDTAIFVDGPWYFQDRKMLNARIAWENDEGNIEVALWGNNLLDEEYADNPGGYVAQDLGAPKTSIEDPLTYGLDLRYSF